MRALRAACVALLWIAFAPARADDAGFVKVIVPGYEGVLKEMLGNEPEPPGGCTLEGARIERITIEADYDCAGEKLKVSFGHPATAGKGAIVTDRFAISSRPTGAAADRLGKALEQRARKFEAQFRWISAEAPGLGRPVEGAVPPRIDGTPFTPEQSEAFLGGVRLFRAGEMGPAYDAFLALARQNPHNGVLGMVVASLASSSLEEERIAALVAAAEAKPDDTLLQFVAGVGSHYHGHRVATTREAKLAAYRQAIKYLERTRPAFDFEPRVYVYLGVSHFRLGDDATAQALIEKAIPLATNDPDVYYCRAEIFQRANLARSLEDVERYLTMVDELHKQGVPLNDAKHARVLAIRDHFRAVAEGRETLPADDALFDPLIDHVNADGTGAASASPVFSRPRSFGLLVIAVAMVAMIAGRLLRRKGSGAGPEPRK